jgi:DNA-binding transcriptional MerR regulator
MAGFTLADLARRAGVSPRTVRYYIQRGLLRAPEFRGPDTQYDESHLLQLQAIRALQEAYRPLDAIAVELHGKSAEQLRAIAAGGTAPAPEVRPGADDYAATSGTRYQLAEGLELWLADDADPAVRRLGDAIRALATRKRGNR